MRTRARTSTVWARHSAKTSVELLGVFANPLPTVIELCPECPPPIGGLIDSMLAFEPADRPSVDLLTVEFRRLRRMQEGSAAFRRGILELEETGEYPL